MRHRKAGRHLGRDTAHRRALYRNLVTDLLRYERIVTTEAKAKEIRPIAEKMVTLGRRGDLHARRQALRYLYDTHVVEHLFGDIAPRMAERPGGYLRIIRLEPRKGDGAKMAAIEFVDYWEEPVAAAAPARAAAVAAPPAAAPGTVTASPETDAEEKAAGDDAPAASAEEAAEAEAGQTAEAEADVEPADTGTEAEETAEEDEKPGDSS
ncbi:MAG: hypothetical protein Kow0010_21900 [Dehalococcoidia bacterium]